MGKKLKLLISALFVGAGFYGRLSQQTGVDFGEFFLIKAIVNAFRPLVPARLVDQVITSIGWAFFLVEIVAALGLLYLVYVYLVKRKRWEFLIAMVSGMAGGYLMPAFGQSNLQTAGVFLSLISLAIAEKILPDVPELASVARLVNEDLEGDSE